MILKESIHALIKESEKQIGAIESEYNIDHEKVKSLPHVKIKNCLENMRSSLDHLAAQIFKDNNLDHRGRSRDKYFPLYTKNLHAFQSHMSKYLPDLNNKNPSLYSELENIQFYNDETNREWMKDLRIVNEYKHENFLEQHKEEKDVTYIGTEKWPSVIRATSKAKGVGFFNCSINGVPLNGTLSEGHFYENNHGIKITRTKEGKYYFSELNKEVIPTLKKILGGVKGIINEFEKF